jgi:signal peptidase I
VFEQLILLLSWLLWPVAAIALVDDWFLRPRRRLAALPAAAVDPPWLKAVHGAVLPLVIAGALRLFRSEELDFSLVLVLISVVGGAIWLLDAWVLAPWRARAAAAAGKPASAVPEPGIVDYARSMVPVVVLVLVLRSFLFEPFRIPSDSMMPTLQDGDFILVNKFSYGIRLPVLNTKVLDLGEPERGDVVVFRWPPNPKVNYIKRVVGLPGDRIKVVSDRIYVNGEPLAEQELGRYSDGCYENMRLSEVHTGEHSHHVLACRSPSYIATPQLPGCNRDLARSYVCDEEGGGAFGEQLPDRGDYPEVTVPAGNYLMIGDNRDNSADGREWGFVPEANLVGGARRVWFNFDWQRKPKIDWKRIGKRID